MIPHETIDDFRKRYHDTFVFLKINGQEHLVQYIEDGQDEDTGDLFFSFYNKNFGHLTIGEAIATETLRFAFPEHGLYNINDEVYLFSRYPQRQWKRAPCHGNTTFLKITSALYRHPLDGISISDHTVAESIFYPKYPKTIKEALMAKCNVAMNKDFAIVKPFLDSHKKTPILFFRTTPVGFVNEENRSFEIHFKPLMQEVLDFIRKYDQTWTIQKAE